MPHKNHTHRLECAIQPQTYIQMFFQFFFSTQKMQKSCLRNVSFMMTFFQLQLQSKLKNEKLVTVETLICLLACLSVRLTYFRSVVMTIQKFGWILTLCKFCFVGCVTVLDVGFSFFDIFSISNILRKRFFNTHKLYIKWIGKKLDFFLEISRIFNNLFFRIV